MLSKQGRYWGELKIQDGRIPRIRTLLRDIVACGPSTNDVVKELKPGAEALPYFSILSAAQLYRGRRTALAAVDGPDGLPQGRTELLVGQTSEASPHPTQSW